MMYCKCGCGNVTNVIKITDNSRNRKVGMFADSVETLQNAINYLGRRSEEE